MNLKTKYFPACLFLLVILLFLNGGCSEFRHRANLPHMRSMLQWQVLARDVARNIVNGKLSGSGSASCFYVQPATGAFGQAFTKMINAELIQASIPGTVDASEKLKKQLPTFSVMQAPDPRCYTVTTTAQVVRYRKNRKPRYFPGTFTALSAGVLVIRDFSTWEEQLILAGGMLTDLFIEPPVPDIEGRNSEVLITTSIEKERKYIFVRNDLYLLRDIDGIFYENSPERPIRSFSLTGE